MRISYAEMNRGDSLGLHNDWDYRRLETRGNRRVYVRLKRRHVNALGAYVGAVYEYLTLPLEDANTDETVTREHLGPLWREFGPLLTWYTLYLKATSPDGELTFRAVATPDNVTYYCSPNKLVNIECDASPYRVSHRSKKYPWRFWWADNEFGSVSSITDLYDFGTVFDAKDQPRVGAVLWDLEKSKVEIASVSSVTKRYRDGFTPKPWK